MNQKSYEQSWNRLESALGPNLQRANSHRISKRNSHSSRLPSSRCISANYRPSNESISAAQIKKIYKAKCEDMGIPVLPDQESRFLSFCLSNFKNRQFNMKESGLGQNSSLAIGKVLKTTDFAYVNLYKNSLGDKGAFNLLKEISDSKSIVHLNLSNNELTPEGFQNIGKILTYHPSIASLDLSSYEGLHRNRISQTGGRFLKNLLSRNFVLQFLCVSGTCLADGIEHVSEGLKGNTTLASLDLSNNSLTSRHMEELSKSVVKSDLKKLNLSNNQINDEGCEYLANMIIGAYEAGCPLIYFNISNNLIGTRGAGDLFSSLRLNCFIKDFNVSGNSFSAGLSHYFPSFLADNCALDSLDLSNCRLKFEALAGVSEGLSKNKVLQKLILSNNKLEDAGVNELAPGLEKNEGLKHLDLSACRIKNQGSVNLVKALRSNLTIQSINLKDNSVKDPAGELLCDLTRTNKNFISLNLDLNPLNLKFVTIIKKNLKENLKLRKKVMVPRMKEELEKIKIPKETYEDLHEKIRFRLEEKQLAEERYEKFNENFDEIKEKEEKKTRFMIEESRVLREKNQNLSRVLEENKSELIVINMQSARVLLDKNVEEINMKIKLAEIEIEHKTRASKEYLGNSLKENVDGKKETVYKQLVGVKCELKHEEFGKQHLENVLSALRGCLESKKKELEILRCQKEMRIPAQFLASEKLAMNKRKYSSRKVLGMPIKQKRSVSTSNSILFSCGVK